MAMAKKSDRITVTALREAMKGKFDNTVTDEWEGLSLTIKRTLSLDEMLTFVEKVVESCYDNDNVFAPERKDIAIRLSTVVLYSNITLPTTLEEQYDFIYRTNIYDFICDKINQNQYVTIMRAIHEKIDDINRMNAADVEARLAEVTSTIDNMQQQMNDIFAGIDADTISKLSSAIIQTQLDEEKLARALVDQRNGNNGNN